MKRVARKAPGWLLSETIDTAQHLGFILLGGLGVVIMRGHATGAFNGNAPDLVWWLAVALLLVSASGIYSRGVERGRTKALDDVLDRALGTVKGISERKLAITIVHNVTSDEELTFKTGVSASEH